MLSSLEPEKIQAYFNDLFAAIPYEHYPVNSEAMVAALINVHLHGARVTARQEVSSSKGRADSVIDLHRKQLTLVFEYKYTDSADAKHLDKKVREALARIREHAFGLNCGSEHRVARFALVFCGAKEVRGLVRVVLADEFMR